MPINTVPSMTINKLIYLKYLYFKGYRTERTSIYKVWVFPIKVQVFFRSYSISILKIVIELTAPFIFLQF